MASIKGPRGGPYRARYRTPDGKSRSRTFKRKADAEALLATIEADKVRGNWTDPARAKKNIAAWSETWLASKVDLRPSSRARLEGIVRTHVLPEFCDCTLGAVTNAAVRAWVARMGADGLSAASVRKAYNALHQMMKAAVADRRIALDPCQDVPLPPERVEEQRFLSAEEVATLADSVKARFRVLVLLAVYGGLRFGELAGLRRKRVDVLRGRVTVAETLSDVDSELTFGLPRRGGRGVRSRFPDALLRNSAPISTPTSRPGETRSSLRGRRERRLDGLAFVGCGGNRGSPRPDWTVSSSTSFGTPSSRCGSRPERTQKRFRFVPGTRPLPSLSIGMGTCTRTGTKQSPTGWTRF